MKTSATDWRLPALAVGLLVLAVGGFFLLFEPVDVERDRPGSRMAQLNPVLAMQRTLDGVGVPSQARFGLGALPPSDHVIVLPALSAEARERLWSRLYPWVEGGGHLVIGLDRGDGDEVEFWDWLGLGFEGSADTGEAWEDPEDADGSPDPAGRVPVLLSSGGLPKRRVELDLGRSLQVREGWTDVLRRDWVDEQGRLVAATMSLGEGRVSVLVDPSPLFNDRIAREDHLLWAADVLDLAAEPAGMLVVLEGGVDRGLLALAWAHTRPLLAGLAFLIVLAVARANARLEPPIAEAAPVRRDLMEAMTAAGRFLWQRGLLTALLDPARRAVPEAATRALPTDEQSLVACVRALQETWRRR